MKKIVNRQTKDYIAEAIRDEILAGNMTAGEELIQEELAEALGVSRMPVREALQTLVQEGFVERLPNRHMQVIALDRIQIKEVFETVAAIEIEIASFVMAKTDVKELAEEMQKSFHKDIGEEELAEVEQNLHQSLLALLQNKYLEQIFDKIMRGYISFAIQNLGEKDKKIDLLSNICEVLLHKEDTKLQQVFHEYYMYYAGQF